MMKNGRAQMKQNVPAFNAGDTVVVQVKVKVKEVLAPIEN